MDCRHGLGSILYPHSHASFLPEISDKHHGAGHAQGGPTTTAVAGTVEAVTGTVATMAAGLWR
jgi:hypothetical protein